MVRNTLHLFTAAVLARCNTPVGVNRRMFRFQNFDFPRFFEKLRKLSHLDEKMQTLATLAAGALGHVLGGGVLGVQLQSWACDDQLQWRRA